MVDCPNLRPNFRKGNNPKRWLNSSRQLFLRAVSYTCACLAVAAAPAA